ncbi:MAG: hypothetical protein HN921_13715 [Bacteroidetes bacterium]|jgi:hypothetical protein|nr:hypothetical protein [Bacteroidota bacterium]MBT4729397.1 hypothetical protein [Bacteroidota bacterium]MBT5990422.1 hypothetical protein [Bacteroidota bacterium]MBT6835164.1 hypothetical protein [Bacteroidota bacterium]MBT7040889.1 hypothetical protein [Bacteroidota bacterium]
MKTVNGLILLFCLFFLFSQTAEAQNVGISTTAATPNSNALLDISSPATGQGKGLLIPRITYAQRTTAGQAGGLLDGSSNLHGGAAQGLMIYQTDGSGDGEGFYYNTSATSTPNWVYISNNSVTERNNHVIVKSVSDFPDAVSGVITLADNVTYEINGTVSLGSTRLVMGVSNVIHGIDKSDDKLVYTGTGSMITSVNQDFTIRTIMLYAPTTGSQVFDVTGSTYKIQLMDNIFYGCKDLGDFNGGDCLVINLNLTIACSEGFEFKGTLNKVFFVSNMYESNLAGTAIRFPSGSFEVVQITNNYFSVNTGLTGLNITAASASVADAKITHNFFTGSGTYLTGVSSAYASWFFYGNTELPDSEPFGTLEIHGNTTATSIASHNTYYKASGANYTSSGELFDTNGVHNRLRYKGVKDMKASYSVTGSIKVASSGNKVKIAVYKNGSTRIGWAQITPSNTTGEFNFSINGNRTLETNDYLEVYVYAQSTPFNITLTELNMSIED